MNIKNQYAVLFEETKNKMKKAESMMAAAEKMKEKQSEIVNKKAHKMNEIFKKRYSSVVLVVCIYSFLVTLFTVIKSDKFISDLNACGSAITKWAEKFIDGIENIAVNFAGIVENVSILYWVIYIFIWILGILLPTGILIFIGKWIIESYRKYCADEISILMALFNIAVCVFFAEYMPINNILVIFLSHLIYVLIRWYRGLC